jgi:hypothetical protein
MPFALSLRPCESRKVRPMSPSPSEGVPSIRSDSSFQATIYAAGFGSDSFLRLRSF